MSTFEQLREGIGRTWDHLTEGWCHLYERASNALTKFTPSQRKSELEPADEYVIRESARWGLLAAEVLEDDKQVIVKLEAPSMDPNDFDIQVVNDALVIRGEKRVEREETGGRFYLMECAYGTFERAIPVPTGVDEARAQAKYRNGVLRIALPKTKVRLRRRIEVQ